MEFDPIQISIDRITLTLFHPIQEETLNDLSHDQRLLLEYARGISEGNLETRWLKMKISPINHARWLTLAIRIMRLYVTEECPSEELKILTKFIVKVYVPCWFQFKTAMLKDSVQIVFQMKQRIDEFHPEIIQLCRKTIQNYCFALLPENFIYGMIHSTEEWIRKKGFCYILQIREK